MQGFFYASANFDGFSGIQWYLRSLRLDHYAKLSDIYVDLKQAWDHLALHVFWSTPKNSSLSSGRWSAPNHEHIRYCDSA